MRKELSLSQSNTSFTYIGDQLVMPAMKRKAASTSNDTNKFREDTNVTLDHYSVSDEVVKLLDGLVKVKEEIYYM